jgi:hypothetical protein
MVRIFLEFFSQWGIGQYTVNTRVSSYVNWIDSTMAAYPSSAGLVNVNASLLSLLLFVLFLCRIN